MTSTSVRKVIATTAALGLALAATGCRGGGGSKDPGISAKKITIGGSFPFSGPLAGYGSLSKGMQAYFGVINARGGVNGRKIHYIALDDAYDPSRLAGNARKLVEQDKVFALASFGGTNLAIRDYMKTQKVPQFVFAGNSPLSDVKHYPTTRAWWPDIKLEGSIAARYALSKDPNARLGTLVVNNDLSASLVAGVRDGLGVKRGQLTSEQTFEPSSTDLTGQVNKLRAAGVTTLISAIGGTQGAAALKYMRQTGWRPLVINYSVTSSRVALTDAAGSAAAGVHTVQWAKDPAEPRWAGQPWMTAYREALGRYAKGTRPGDPGALNGYAFAQALVKVLERMKDPTREGLLKAWDSIDGVQLDPLMPGVVLKAGPDGRLVHAYQPAHFDGRSWIPDGPVVSAR
ncbi:ABC transporter substrate-binding protein [Actinomadura opuntiae]|uniref:ABC transporter substrate-binding protein n=1 Tax=Actinomadura sp. OS1-43 TaxID=604315 RepID=UPI00255B3847|nr:ABC transporter substrate-binding protein [Actinomadura sp. OS1-43]MDL4812678.1 ABC transporter substrate-binding protein [Actinomadura sp. OS1-43]